MDQPSAGAVGRKALTRAKLLAADSERRVYLELLRRYMQLRELDLLGYCLMSDHADSLARRCLYALFEVQ